MATLNSRITHETVDGAINQKEVEAMKVQGVPSVFADGKLINVGRSDLGELLSKLEAQYGINEGGVDNSVEKPVKNYDVLIVGGGPAGAASAIYSARKGLNRRTGQRNGRYREPDFRSSDYWKAVGERPFDTYQRLSGRYTGASPCG